MYFTRKGNFSLDTVQTAENEDWHELSPIVFFLGGNDLLKKKRAAGISIYYHNFGDSGPQAEEQESES